MVTNLHGIPRIDRILKQSIRYSHINALSKLVLRRTILIAKILPLPSQYTTGTIAKMLAKRYMTEVLLCLVLATAVYAHDEHEHMSHESMEHGHMDHSDAPAPTGSPDTDPSYFTYPHHKGLLYAHIALMSIGWIVVLPVAAVLSVAGSRYHLPLKVSFLALNGAGIFFSSIYNASTPDLYPNNSHHKLGWAIVWILLGQSVFGVLGAVGRSACSNLWGSKEGRSGFMPVSMRSPTEAKEMQHNSHHYQFRVSGDSGQGSEHYSLRSPSVASFDEERDQRDASLHDWKPVNPESHGWISRVLETTRLESLLSRRAPILCSERTVQISNFIYSLVERVLIILGFTQISLGIVTGSGIFMGSRVFNGLAHFIKGGIFFLYGVLTLGRWLGAFSELGWAWNIKPPAEFGGKWRSRIPSGEMVESLVIFLYGVSNVFLEHLASWGSTWSHGDLEHVSIAFMFFGGGLCGMLVESKRVRELLNRTISSTVKHSANRYAVPTGEFQSLSDCRVSYNPLPALVIFILGIMMSKHHQSLALSTTIHTQWGMLLSGFAVFRLGTYALTYIKPPTSYFPSRPPTELLASFCLMAGGLVFMCSNKDTVGYLDTIGADPMFILTVMVGITALFMSWVTVVMAIKGWAFEKEQKRISTDVSSP
ncbi:hypothetical protein RUND412_006045 [Rhizina undulata]